MDLVTGCWNYLCIVFFCSFLLIWAVPSFFFFWPKDVPNWGRRKAERRFLFCRIVALNGRILFHLEKQKAKANPHCSCAEKASCLFPVHFCASMDRTIWQSKKGWFFLSKPVSICMPICIHKVAVVPVFVQSRQRFPVIGQDPSWAMAMLSPVMIHDHKIGRNFCLSFFFFCYKFTIKFCLSSEFC